MGGRLQGLPRLYTAIGVVLAVATSGAILLVNVKVTVGEELVGSPCFPLCSSSCAFRYNPGGSKAMGTGDGGCVV